MSGSVETLGEGFTNPYASALEATNGAIRARVIEQRFKEFSDVKYVEALLFPGLINESVIEPSAQNYAYTEAEEVLRQREVGLINDTHNTMAGIYITGHGRNTDIRQLQEVMFRQETNITITIFESDNFFSYYGLHLPEGGYELEDHGNDIPGQKFIHIYRETEYDHAGTRIKQDRLGIYADENSLLGKIGRIVGADGSLWQNPETMRDGSMRPQEDTEEDTDQAA